MLELRSDEPYGSDIAIMYRNANRSKQIELVKELNVELSIHEIADLLDEDLSTIFECLAAE